MKKIAIVDDDVLTHNVVTMLLKHYYTVHSFKRSEDLKEWLKSNRPDLMLIDLHIHDRYEGERLLKELNQMEGLEDIPKAVVSADTMHKSRYPLFLDKNFLLSKLRGFVDSLLRK